MIAAAPALRDGIDGKAFQNAKGEDMLGIGIDIGSAATKIAVLDESGAVVDVDVRPTGFSSAEAAPAAGEYLASQGFLTGGLCDNDYFVERLASALGRYVQTEPNARFAGAIGAAIAVPGA